MSGRLAPADQLFLYEALGMLCTPEVAAALAPADIEHRKSYSVVDSRQPPVNAQNPLVKQHKRTLKHPECILKHGTARLNRS